MFVFSGVDCTRSQSRDAAGIIRAWALGFLWFARPIAQRSDFQIFVRLLSLLWPLGLVSSPSGTSACFVFAIVHLLSFRGVVANQ